VEDIELDLEKSIFRQHNVNDMYDKLERYKEEVESLIPNESNAYRLNSLYCFTTLDKTMSDLSEKIKNSTDHIEQLNLRELRGFARVFKIQKLHWWNNCMSFIDQANIAIKGEYSGPLYESGSEHEDDDDDNDDASSENLLDDTSSGDNSAAAADDNDADDDDDAPSSSSSSGDDISDDNSAAANDDDDDI